MFILNPNGKNSSKNFGRVKRKFFSDGDSPLRIASSRARERERNLGSLAEWSKAKDSGSFPKGRGFKSLNCQKHTAFFFALSYCFRLRRVVNVRGLFDFIKIFP